MCHAVLVSVQSSGERYECYTSARTEAPLVQPRKQLQDSEVERYKQ